VTATIINEDSYYYYYYLCITEIQPAVLEHRQPVMVSEHWSVSLPDICIRPLHSVVTKCHHKIYWRHNLTCCPT